MKLLDLYCCAGGAAMGYHRAGFTVSGVDHKPQSNYPFQFFLGDALDLAPKVLTSLKYGPFVAIHASPPCQDHSKLKVTMPALHGTGDLLAQTREFLQSQELPWIIENVPGAPMRADYTLCGCMFNLPGLRRERWFETSWEGFDLNPPCLHKGIAVDVVGHGQPGREYRRRKELGLEAVSQEERNAAMGIDWMNRDELAQAIPPAYTEYLGQELRKELNV